MFPGTYQKVLSIIAHVQMLVLVLVFVYRFTKQKDN